MRRQAGFFDVDERLKELSTGEGVETCERLIEKEDLGTFRERKRECDLRALPARE